MGRIGDLHSAKEEGNRSTVGCINPRIRPYYSRRCKSKRVNSTNIDSLPDEMLLEILVRVSADYIYGEVRFVCRKWYNLIRTDAFVYAHLHRTSCGLLFLSDVAWSINPIFVAATQGWIEAYKLSYGCRFPTVASCNGLLLGVDFTGKNPSNLLNPVTKRAFNLPRFFDGVGRGYFGIAYVAASMEYKVVGAYYPDRESSLVQCVILTVGVDNTWRHVGVEQLSPEANELLLRIPLITEGFMHWAFEGNDVLSLNAETEIIRETPAPLPLGYQENIIHGYYYLSTGRYLSVLISCGDLLWEVWEMKPESGEWRKLPCNINLEAHKCRLQQFAREGDDASFFRPLGWVKYPEVLAFCFGGHGRSCIICNLNTNEISSFNKNTSSHGCYALVHRNSLVSLF